MHSSKMTERMIREPPPQAKILSLMGATKSLSVLIAIIIVRHCAYLNNYIFPTTTPIRKVLSPF